MSWLGRLVLWRQHDSLLPSKMRACFITSMNDVEKELANINLEKRLIVIIPLWRGPAYRCWGFQCFLIVLRIKH